MSITYEKYRSLNIKIADIHHATALLAWDQETYMPKGGAEFRSQQIATLEGIAHELFVSDEMKNYIIELSLDTTLNNLEKKNVSKSQYDFTLLSKMPNEFVKELSKTVSICLNKWVEARKENKFELFAPYLKLIVELKRKEAEYLGYRDGHIYDALLQRYEEENTCSRLDILFADVREQLKPLLDKVLAAPPQHYPFLEGNYNKNLQWEFGLDILKYMGYDFNCGRQDVSVHPFTTNFSMKDVRVTTRLSENQFENMLWSTIHEGGHALYEQGLPENQYGLPLSQAISLSVHESQSRIWENNIGRSLEYWTYHFPKMQQVFPANLKNIDLNTFYKAINQVKPSHLRTEADELTYHFHIMIRYELEKALIGGEMEIEDIPTVWNTKYYEYLGMEVPNDAMGCLQDVHWSHGLFGYFPTYSQGSIMAAQWMYTIQSQIPTLFDDMKNGSTEKLLNWLRENIHKHGRYYTSRELCEKITGEPLNFKYFLEYATKKYEKIYS